MDTLKMCEAFCSGILRATFRGNDIEKKYKRKQLENDISRFVKDEKWVQVMKKIRLEHDVDELIHNANKDKTTENESKVYKKVYDGLIKLANHKKIPEHPLFQQGTKKIFEGFAFELKRKLQSLGKTL